MDIEAKNQFLRANSLAPPPVAIGHVSVKVSDVAAATQFFEALGLRWVHQSESHAVMELRGGTHLVVRRAEGPVSPGSPAPFDLMVDDVPATHAEYAAKGVSVSEIKGGSIHKSFAVTGPDGYEITVTSSHTMGRAV